MDPYFGNVGFDRSILVHCWWRGLAIPGSLLMHHSPVGFHVGLQRAGSLHWRHVLSICTLGCNR